MVQWILVLVVYFCASLMNIDVHLHHFFVSTCLPFFITFFCAVENSHKLFLHYSFPSAANLHHGRSLIYRYWTFFLKAVRHVFFPDQPLSKQHTFIFLSFNIQQLPRVLGLFEHNKYHVCLKNCAPFHSLELKLPRFPSKCNSSRLKGLFFCNQNVPALM